MQGDNENNLSKLFKNNKDKVEAFDYFADVIKNKGFGSLTKSDYDLLLFSIVLDKLYKDSNGDYNKVSNYNISKLLGITQNRVSSLKEKKELVYPSKDYEWKDVFCSCLKNCIYDNGNIKVQIFDRTTFLELKNIIDSQGGFVEIQLTPNLLSVKPGYFIKLIMEIYGENSDAMKETVIKAVKDNKQNMEDITLSDYEKVLAKIDESNFVNVVQSILDRDVKGMCINALKLVCEVFKK